MKNANNMKKILVSILAAVAVASAAAQTQAAYFMEGTTFRSRFNPAFAPLRGYVNIPGISGFAVNTDGGLSLDAVVKRSRNGELTSILSPSVPAGQALAGLSRGMNSLNANSTVNILGFGMYTRNRRNFWSVDVNAHVETAFDVPYEFFDFIKNGNSNSIRGMQVCLDTYVDVGFNYSMPLTDRLYVGARVKFLVGLGRAQMQLDRMDVSLRDELWYATAAAHMDFYSNGSVVKVKDNGEFDSFEFGMGGPAGYGAAIDLGATYDVLDNLQVSLAVNDLGFISWNKGSAYNFATTSQTITFGGVDVDVEGDGAGGVQTTTGDVDFTLEDMKFLQGESRGATRMVRATLNAGVEYELWRHKIGLGLLYHARMGGYKSSHNLTASVNFHPVRWFTLTPSYTFNNNSAHAVGLALNLCPNWINFFLATDMLLSQHGRYFIPYKQSRMNFTVGIGIPLGPRSFRIDEYVKESEYTAYACREARRAQRKADRARRRYGN